MQSIYMTHTGLLQPAKLFLKLREKVFKNKIMLILSCYVLNTVYVLSHA